MQLTGKHDDTHHLWHGYTMLLLAFSIVALFFGSAGEIEAGWITKPAGFPASASIDTKPDETPGVRRGWFKSYQRETPPEDGGAPPESADQPEEPSEPTPDQEEDGTPETDTSKTAAAEPMIPVASLGAWLPIIEPGGEIFPALHLTLAMVNLPRNQLKTLKEADPEKEPDALGDQDGLIGIVIRSPENHFRLQIQVSCPALMSPSGVEVVLPQKGFEYTVFPKVVWDFDKLMACRQTQPANVSFTLFGDSGKIGEKVQTVRVRTINDCPYFYTDGDTQLDLNWMFTAYANEDHPVIDKVLQEALKSGVVERFDGYQSGDSNQVILQVFAIWNALRARGIKYSSITRTPSESEAIFSQHVRFLDQIIENTQANCVDGSILFASLLRKIDLDPFLVVLPSHAFIGLHLDGEHKSQALVETTLLAAADPDESETLESAEKALPAKWRNSPSWKAFKLANSSGAEQFEEDRTNLEGSDPMYQVIDLEEARQRGIMPIAYRKP